MTDFATDRSGGSQTQRQTQTTTLPAPGPMELALRRRFRDLGMSQVDAINTALTLSRKGSLALSPEDQRALDAAYAGAEANLRRDAFLMGQDLGGTQGLNPSDTPVGEAVARQFLPAFASLQSNKAAEGLGLGLQTKRLNQQGLLQGGSAVPGAGLSLMSSLQGERFAQPTVMSFGTGTFDTWNTPSILNQMKTGTEMFRNVGQGVGSMALLGLSDRRLKVNITPVSWNWKADPSGTYFGVIAQELEQNHPHLVTRHPNGYRMVDYSTMVAMLLSERAWLYHQLESKDTSYA